MLKPEIKEEFCGACLAIPAVIAGVGVAGYGAKKGTHDKTKKIMLWSGIALTIVSAAIAIYFIMRCKNCR